MVVFCRSYIFITVYLWSLLQLITVKPLTFELPERNRMCFFETIDIGSRCHLDFQASQKTGICDLGSYRLARFWTGILVISFDFY